MSIDIEEGRHLLAAATPGPWSAGDWDTVIVRPGEPFGEKTVAADASEQDAAAIVWAVNNVSALIEENEKKQNSILVLVGQRGILTERAKKAEVDLEKLRELVVAVDWWADDVHLEDPELTILWDAAVTEGRQLQGCPKGHPRRPRCS